MTPLGRDVVPDVKKTMAGSSGSRGGNDSAAWSPEASEASGCQSGDSIQSAGASTTRGVHCASTSATNAGPEPVAASSATAPARQVAWMATTASTVLPTTR